MPLNLSLLLCFLLCCITQYGRAQQQGSSVKDTVYQSRTLDFTRANGGYQRPFYLQDFGNDRKFSGEHTINTSIAKRMNTEGGALRVKLLANEIGDAGGMWSYTLIGRSTTTKVLQYDVKFGYVSSPFDWAMGGKIPGLGGGKNYSGCVSTEAGDGWTSRLMWRTEDNGKAYLMPYLYYADKQTRCGDDFGAKYFGKDGKGLRSGIWYRVRMEITMNTNADYNGSLKIIIQDNVGNDKWTQPSILIDKQNIRYATKPEGLEIDQLMTGVYRGGSNVKWASATDGYIFFDNLSWSN